MASNLYDHVLFDLVFFWIRSYRIVQAHGDIEMYIKIIIMIRHQTNRPPQTCKLVTLKII